MSASNLLVAYPRYKLVVSMIKLVLNFMQKNEKQMNELGEKRILVDTLCLHLDVMTKYMDIKGDVEVIKTVLEYDWERLSNLQVTIDTVIRKCDFGPVSDLKMVKKPWENPKKEL